jgi:Secretion system C-terminal sorting domain
MLNFLTKIRVEKFFQLKYNACIIILFGVFTNNLQAQTVLNAYAKVTGFTLGNTVISVSNVNEVNHTFDVGEQVIIFQMQDDVIGTNTSNNNTFGNLSAIANAGNYEVRTITAKTPATGTPTSITLNSALTYTFNTGTNASVQVVTFRNLGTNYTTIANIGGLPWDGNIGGVIAIQVSNDLTLNHSISANGIGFRGGARSTNNGGPICGSGNQNVFISASANYATKGEGIYKNTTAGYTYARGRLLNGGGGGADHNGGGGGGGNFTQGGQGGNGYNNCTAYPSGGLGGAALGSSISASRLFMGGGGGGGQQNNSVGTQGGNGGGIVVIKANRILSNTTCPAAISITSNGVTAGNSGNDGAGGGGAGGCILFQVNSFNITSACPLTITANAGNGGNSGNSAAHAGGGGGAQGAVIFSSPVPVGNITVATNNGLPGTDNRGGQITATSGSGSNNSGIITAASTPLPIQLLYFKSTCSTTNGVFLTWATASEKDNDHFIVDRMSAGGIWEPIAIIDGAGTSNFQHLYSYSDIAVAAGTTYYRLRQVDFNGVRTLLAPTAVTCENEAPEVSIFPNPANAVVTVQSAVGFDHVEIYDHSGRLVSRVINPNMEQQLQIDISAFQPACYTVRVTVAGKIDHFKLIKAN